MCDMPFTVTSRLEVNMCWARSKADTHMSFSFESVNCLIMLRK